MFCELKNQPLANGEILSYREAGGGNKKPPLLLLHGNQSSSLFFEDLMHALESKAHIFAVDLAGFGESTYARPHETLKEWADDVALFMEEKNITSAIVLGWSAGGGIAMELAAGYPEKVRHLIPVASVGVKGFKMPKLDLALNPIPGRFHSDREEIARDPLVIAANMAINSKNAMVFRTLWEQKIFDLNPPEEPVFDAYMQEILKERCFTDLCVALCQFNITHEQDLTAGSGRISNIQCPVTWIHGRQDQSVPFETAQESVIYFESPARFCLIEDAGHAVFMDKPEEAEEILTGILTGIRKEGVVRKAQSRLEKMSVEEKVALCSGADFWRTKAYEDYDIPALFLCDGPHGLRKMDGEGTPDLMDLKQMDLNHSTPATCFPAAVTTASSWDPELLEEIGRAIGEEAHAQKAGVVLGPGANLKRNPLCGRNFEYFSEDPHLAGKLAAGFIRGVESEGIGACLKHFAANSREYYRFNSNSVMDERTLRELYLSAFETAVKEGSPSAVMCAYPKLNGVHCSDNKKLLSEILREEWGFDGLVVTDWGAMNDRVLGFQAGCDLNMPGGSAYMEKEVLAAIQAGSLSEEKVDASAKRIIQLALREAETLKRETDGNYEEHHQLAKEAAFQGAVLLKNEDHILPVDEEKKIAVIGYMAKHLRYQGGGSSHINAIRVSNPYDYLSKELYAEGCDGSGNTSEELLKEAAEKAGQAEVAIVFAGLPDRYDSEGFDRADMKMPEGHNRMIETVAEANPNTVVVLFSGSAVECPWSNHVKGILYMGLPGEAGGEAVADLIHGKENPCGKLSESWPFTYENCISSSFFAKDKDALYLEGIYVGYRYYDKAHMAVRWPFGFGLSYTEFEYSEIALSGDTVSFIVKNIGDTEGAEIAQLYIEAPQKGIHRPIRELKHFAKIRLEPGESRLVTFTLTDRDFSVWQDGWKVPAGEYTICIGGSSRDLPLKKKLQREGAAVPAAPWERGSFYESCEGKPALSDLENEMGMTYKPEVLKKGCFTMDSTVLEMKDHSLVMKIVYKVIESIITKVLGGKKDPDDPEFRFLMASSAGSPLRSLVIFGGLKGEAARGLLEMANGHFFRGIKKILSRQKG